MQCHRSVTISQRVALSQAGSLCCECFIIPTAKANLIMDMTMCSCTAGDAAYKSKPLQLTRTSLTNLLEKCSFPSYTLITFGFKRFHLTHHVQYDGNKDGGDPIAMVLLLRIARNSQSISIAMRICLADLSTTVFVTSMSEETGRVIREKCIERRCLLAKHPLYFLALIYEVRCADYKAWFDDILEEINVVESATGMTRNTWKMQLSPKLWDWFSDYDNLLKQLYSSHTELSHFDTVTVFSIKFGDFLLDALDLLRGLPAEVGFEPMTTKEARELRERIKFTRSRCDLTLDKTKEMLERVRGQINVVSISLPATVRKILTRNSLGFQSRGAKGQQDQSCCSRRLQPHRKPRCPRQ